MPDVLLRHKSPQLRRGLLLGYECPQLRLRILVRDERTELWGGLVVSYERPELRRGLVSMRHKGSQLRFRVIVRDESAQLRGGVVTMGHEGAQLPPPVVPVVRNKGPQGRPARVVVVAPVGHEGSERGAARVVGHLAPATSPPRSRGDGGRDAALHELFLLLGCRGGGLGLADLEQIGYGDAQHLVPLGALDKRVHKHVDAGGPLLGILDEALGDEFHKQGEVFPRLGQRGGRVLGHRLHGHDRVHAGLGGKPLRHLDAGYPHGPNITPRVVVLLQYYLGGHPVRAARHLVRLSNGSTELLRHPEIRQFDIPILGHEDVGRLDVAVDNSPRVQVRQPLERVHQDILDLLVQ
mmetsp:Transcript_2255/g.6245  ORF Transcript_2255/g.6245 Transcript_2255/m.6245 type:complete len:351 (-) Transcript_2255:1113-2165(-)